MNLLRDKRKSSTLCRVALSMGVAALFGCLAFSTLDAKISIDFRQPAAMAAIPESSNDAEPAAVSEQLDSEIQFKDVPSKTIQPIAVATVNAMPQQYVPIEKKNVSPWNSLIARLEADGFKAPELEKMFSSLNCPPLPEFMAQKAVELYGRYGKAKLILPEERGILFAPPNYSRIAGGMSLAAGRRAMENNKKFFNSLYKQYGVPAPFIVAVMMVETGLGSELGKHSAMLALGSMSVTDSLDHVLPVVIGIDKNKNEMETLIKARSDQAYKELNALLRYAEASGKDAATIPGSIYGAIGICQFMPSNIRIYGVSASKNRAVPDVFLFADAATSIARYLSAHGWRKAQTPEAQIQALLSYNHSTVYASTVYGVGSALMSPTTHQSAVSARSGGNVVKTARESARTALPSAKGVKNPISLKNYSDLLK